jgi:hypothetical protein
MVGDNECDGFKKERIGQSAAKLSLKKVEGSTTRKIILNDIYIIAWKNSHECQSFYLFKNLNIYNHDNDCTIYCPYKRNKK